MPRVSLTRKISFSSGHRYWDASLTPEQNRERFGKWASPYNHGHNYVCQVTTSGLVQPENGMVVNIKFIDDILKDQVLKVYDQKSINDEIPEFAHQSPSLENLLRDLWQRIEPALPSEVALTNLKLEETPLLYAELDENTKMTLTRTYEFAASHRLNASGLSHEENLKLFGKCNNPNGHGHNYVLEVTVGGVPGAGSGMLVDLVALDSAVNAAVVDRYDHKNLDQDVPELSGQNTTSEIVALTIFQQLDGKLPATLERVRLWETARNMFEVTRSDMG
jgi:6-pyruvoyltetrahydropterin/6-carboxytetrahydropterin synthase